MKANGHQTYKVETLTATKEGLAAFLLDLKRAQLRHRLPVEAWAKLKKGPRSRKQSYAEAIDTLVQEWEEQHRATVQANYDATMKRAAAATKSAKEAAALGVMVIPSPLDQDYAEEMKKDAEQRLHKIKDYLGALNRDINEPRIETYASEMSGGKWWFTPDPIVVTTEGFIINGQHRLLAAEGVLLGEQGRYVGSGATRYFQEFAPWPEGQAPQFVVVWNVDKRAAILMDEARRTATDRRDIAMRYAKSTGH